MVERVVPVGPHQVAVPVQLDDAGRRAAHRLDTAGIFRGKSTAEQVAVVQQVGVVDALRGMPAVNDVALHVNEVGVLAAARGRKQRIPPLARRRRVVDQPHRMVN